MKNGLKIAFVYVGLIIGAGFASGREIMEYFNLYSQTDLTGIVLAGIAFAVIAYVILNYAYKHNISSLDGYINKIIGKLSPLVKLFMCLFMYSGFFVMHSGAGTLISQTTGISKIAGIWFLAAVCFIVFCFDAKGVIALNSLLVPFMIIGIVYICISSIISSNIAVFSNVETFYKNRLTSALCYVSYNTITAGAVLIPLTSIIDRRSIKVGAFIGGGILGLLIFIVWTTLNIYYSLLESSEIPLFDLATLNGDIYKTIYFIVLFMAICTTAVSHGFGLLSQLNLPSKFDRVICSAVLCLLAVPFATFGFSVLVAHLYSFFGYIGIVWMAMIIFRYITKR